MKCLLIIIRASSLDFQEYQNAFSQNRECSSFFNFPKSSSTRSENYLFKNRQPQISKYISSTASHTQHLILNVALNILLHLFHFTNRKNFKNSKCFEVQKLMDTTPSNYQIMLSSHSF